MASMKKEKKSSAGHTQFGLFRIVADEADERLCTAVLCLLMPEKPSCPLLDVQPIGALISAFMSSVTAAGRYWNREWA